MEYTPTEWKSGDVITAEKLNKLEQGIVNSNSGMLEVIMTAKGASDEEGFQLNKTWQEIYDAFPNVYVIVQNDEDDVFVKEAISQVFQTLDEYGIDLISPTASYFSAETANDYPVSNTEK